jgi:hypothetical protein
MPVVWVRQKQLARCCSDVASAIQHNGWPQMLACFYCHTHDTPSPPCRRTARSHCSASRLSWMPGMELEASLRAR